MNSSKPLSSSPLRGEGRGEGQAKARWLACLLIFLSVALLLLGITVGSTGFESVANMLRDPQAMQIIWEIRLPRTVGAWLAGALLGLAGAVAQGLFRNPLADPYLLGSASGASLGVALAIKLTPKPLWEECLREAERAGEKLPRMWWGAAFIVLIWAVAFGGFAWWCFRWLAAR